MLTSGKQEMCLVLTEWYQPYSSHNLKHKGNRTLHFLKLIHILPFTSSVVVIDRTTLEVHGRTVAQIRVPQILWHRRVGWGRGERESERERECVCVCVRAKHARY
jgi:hypothetical protein